MSRREASARCAARPETLDRGPAGHGAGAVPQPVQEPAGADPDLRRRSSRWSSASGPTPAIVLAIVLGSALLGFVQEYRAGNAVEKLRSQVTHPVERAARRAAADRCRPSEVVPGDVVLLSAGSLIPADGVRAGGQGLLRQPGGADRRDLPGREAARRRSPPTPAWPSAPTASSWAPACAAARRACWSCRPARPPCSAQIAERLRAAPARDRVRARHPALRLPADAASCWCW